jgi:hypothetical protein
VGPKAIPPNDELRADMSGRANHARERATDLERQAAEFRDVERGCEAALKALDIGRDVPGQVA